MPGTPLNNLRSFSRSVTRFLVACCLASGLVACGGGSSSSAPSPAAKAITAYSLAGVNGTINEPGKTISVTVPFGTNVTSLAATFTHTGAGIAVGATAQISGTTTNDFSSPVVYTVTATDNSTVDYTVTVTIATQEATWTARTSPTPNALVSVEWSGTQFVAVDTAGVIFKSATGTSWSQAGTTTGVPADIACDTSAGFCLVVSVDGHTSTSTDNGATWNADTQISGATGIRSVSWNGTIWVAVGDAGEIWKSTDVASGWSTAASSGSVSDNLQAVLCIPSNHACGLGGDAGRLMASTNGDTWIPLTSPTASALYGAATGGAKSVVVGASGTILTSSNMVSWSTVTTGSYPVLRGVQWTGSFYAVAGDGGAILTSPDGTTWTQQASGTTNNLNAVAVSSSGTAVVVGAGGAIITSP